METQLGSKNLDTLPLGFPLGSFGSTEPQVVPKQAGAGPEDQGLRTGSGTAAAARGARQGRDRARDVRSRGLKEKLGPSHPETLYNAAMLASVMEVLGHAQERPVKVRGV